MPDNCYQGIDELFDCLFVWLLDNMLDAILDHDALKTFIDALAFQVVRNIVLRWDCSKC